MINYPRWGRHGWRRWIPSWQLMSGIFLLGLGILSVTAMAVYANVEVPSPDASAKAQTTYVYYDDGKTLIGKWSSVNRTIVPLDSVPLHVRNAVLSAEDRTFFTNRGVSVTGLVRAAWKTSSGSNIQGGSTITQQYVKIVLLKDSSRTATRKAKEFVIALKINREKSKEQILGDYLNAIYFGRGAYGVDAAARVYFGVPASKLTPSQGAFLAGIIRGPGLYEPTDPQGLARAKDRWAYVADGMVTIQAISSEERAKMAFPTKFAPYQVKTTAGGESSQDLYLLQMVRDEVVKKRNLMDQKELETAGYKIVTTFNKNAIELAVKAVGDKLGSRKKWPSGTQAALVAIDPRTGAVKAIYGGDGKRYQNAVYQDIVQAGSTFKVFTLLAALEGDPGAATSDPAWGGGDGTSYRGAPLSLYSRFDGKSPQVIDGQKVRNFDDEQYGQVSLLTATEHSINTAYVLLNHQIGPERTMNAAGKAGVPKDLLHANLVNVLGTDYPHPIDMASAYATIAARGVYHKPFVVQKLINSSGGQTCCTTAAGEERFDSDVTDNATYAMRRVVTSGTGSYASRLYQEAAGKTGTSEESKSAWFVGFTKQLSTAVALYRVGPKGESLPLEGFRGYRSSQMTGGGLPVRVWTQFMSQVLKGQPDLGLPDMVESGETYDPAPRTSSSDETEPDSSVSVSDKSSRPDTGASDPLDTPTGGTLDPSDDATEPTPTRSRPDTSMSP